MDEGQPLMPNITQEMYISEGVTLPAILHQVRGFRAATFDSSFFRLSIGALIVFNHLSHFTTAHLHRSVQCSDPRFSRCERAIRKIRQSMNVRKLESTYRQFCLTRFFLAQKY